MIFSKVPLSATALLASLQAVVAMPAPEDAVADTNKPAYELPEVIRVDSYNITL